MYSLLTNNATQSFECMVDLSNEKPLLVFPLDQNVRSHSEQEKIDSIQNDNDMTYFSTNFSEPISLDLVSPKKWIGWNGPFRAQS